MAFFPFFKKNSEVQVLVSDLAEMLRNFVISHVLRAEWPVDMSFSAATKEVVPRGQLRRPVPIQLKGAIRQEVPWRPHRRVADEPWGGLGHGSLSLPRATFGSLSNNWLSGGSWYWGGVMVSTTGK